jgi:hypothetical protein
VGSEQVREEGRGKREKGEGRREKGEKAGEQGNGVQELAMSNERFDCRAI